MNYIVYNLSLGNIVKGVSCDPSSIEYQYNHQEEGCIESNEDIQTGYIQNGSFVLFPPKPSGPATFDYQTKQWVRDTSVQEELVKNQRDELLYQSDWTQIPNNPLTEQKQQEWAVYRQQLRDVTDQSGYPFDVIWPTKPE